MHILVVDEEVPYPLNSGKRIRTFNLLAPLAARHDITFVCRWREGFKSSSLDPFGIHTVVVDDPTSKNSGPSLYAALFANLFSRYPYSVTSHRSKLMIRTIAQQFTHKRFDLIHCEWTPYLINLLPFMPFPSVVDAHNVETEIWRRNCQIERHPLKKMFIRLQWQKMQRFEQKALPLFSRVIAVSEPDRAFIARWAKPEQVEIISNGVDTGYFKPAGWQQKPFSMVFTGSLDWRPNVDAILYFLDGIWPLIRASHPEASFTIVGRRPTDVLKDKAGGMPGIMLTGTVDDVRPYMEEAQVYVVPLRVGGGSRLKILEALSMKKAVVSTSVGAEGLDVCAGENILTADAPAEFAAAVSRLYRESALRERLGTSGRRLVESRYEWQSLSKILEQLWFAVAVERDGIKN